MKGRESGMPDEAAWASFFDVDAALDALFGTDPLSGDLTEFGCGYGTFTLPLARRLQGLVTVLDIEPEMVALVRKKAADRRNVNIRGEVRDFAAAGTGLPEQSQRYAVIFNLLHLEQPVALLSEAFRALQPGGVLAIMHWRSDIPTPRGPSLSIRPRPEQCATWAREAGFRAVQTVDLQQSCPYHFGLIARR